MALHYVILNKQSVKRISVVSCDMPKPLKVNGLEHKSKAAVGGSENVACIPDDDNVYT